MPFDWLIRGGTVLDGIGGPGRRADVGLTGDRVSALAPALGGEAAQVVDAAGCIVALDLLLETEGQVSMIHFLMLDAGGLQFPHVTIGSDNLGSARDRRRRTPGNPTPGSTDASRRSWAPTSASTACSAGRPPSTG